MKVRLRKFLVFTLLISSLNSTSAEQSNIEQYAYMTQDSIDLVEDVLKWNGSAVTIDEMGSLIKSTYSLTVGAYNPEFSQLLAVLKVVKDSGIEDRLITLNLHSEKGAGGADEIDLFTPKKKEKKAKSEPETWLRLEETGQLLLSGEPIELTDLTERVTDDEPISFVCIGPSKPSQIYEVFQALNQSSRPHIRFIVELRRMVELKAEVVEIQDDGTEKKLSSPRISTKSGNVASMGVREKQPESKEDLYQQNGRSGGGVSFTVFPQVIGDYIKVTGSISVKRIKGSEAFKIDNQSMRNYSTETIVIPFAYVFDKDTDTVEFNPVEIGGKKIVCRLQAFHVSDQGKRISYSER